MVTGATPTGLFASLVGLIFGCFIPYFCYHRSDLSFVIRDDMLVESPCLDGGKESELVPSDVILDFTIGSFIWTGVRVIT